MSDSVTIAGHPVAFDEQCRLRGFLRDRMPPAEVLFSRWVPGAKHHAAGVPNFEAFTPPYPELPTIEIGEVQWPSGASRYARALYIVDRPTLLSIAAASWGMQTAEFDTSDVPADWSIEGIGAVDLVITGEEQFTAKMLPLPPYRIPGTGTELFLLSLVDARFLRLNIAWEPLTAPASFPALFDQLAAMLGVDLSYDPDVSSDYGKPCPYLLRASIQAAPLLDCAALSVGLRCVVDPATDTMRLLNAADSDTRCQATIAKPTIIAGGFRGRAVVPSRLAMWCRQANQLALECNMQIKKTADIPIAGDDEAAPTYDWLAHSAWIVDYRLSGLSMVEQNASATSYYVDRVASDVAGWLNSGGQYGFAGAILYAPSGYDDYLTIRTAENEAGENWFSSRVYELPSMFGPQLYLNQDPSVTVLPPVDQFTVADQEESPGKAYVPGSPSKMVLINGLGDEEAGATITAFYKCGTGWTKLASIAGGGSGSPLELYVFTLTSDLAGARGATASADAYAANVIGGSTSTITVTNTGQFRAFDGAEGVAVKLPTGDYAIITVNQPYMRVLAKLDAHPLSAGSTSSDTFRFGADPRETQAAIARSPAPQGLTNYPHSDLVSAINFAVGSGAIMVDNPLKKFGEAGDWVILEWQRAFDAYIVTDVIPQRVLEAWGKLDDDFDPGDLARTISVALTHPAGDGAITTPSFAQDLFNVAINGKDGDKCYVKWSSREQGYLIIAGEHLATRFKAKIASDFYGRPDDFTVTPLANNGLNGIDLPTTPDVTVVNRWGWEAGEADQELEVEWDPRAGEWYPVNMVCPDDPTPTYF